jgi:hypothetical protein
MGLLDWFGTRRTAAQDPRLMEWRRVWTAAAANPGAAAATKLDADLAACGLPAEEIEVEQEMLDGLSLAVSLLYSIRAGGPPVIATGHRVVGSDTCHFSAPSSMPDEADQPSGRLFLTSGRVIFAGGGKARTIPWHAVGQALHSGRDLVIIRIDRDQPSRFRGNTYGDALCATHLARYLMGATRRPV